MVKIMTREHILVADDEQNTLLTMQFILEAAGYRVTTACNGQEALDKVMEAGKGNDPVDLLIADVQMPRLTGLELIDELNRLDIHIPLLITTGYRTDELVEKLIERGGSRCLDKPIDDQELLQCVAMLLEANG
jgi:two-component system chemotaxis sensor kinase CheA